MNRVWLKIPRAAAVFLCLCLVSVVQAQDFLTATYTTGDGSFQFQHPVTWGIHERNDGTLTIGRDNLSLWIIPPSGLEILGDDLVQARTAGDLLNAFIAATEGEFEFGSPEKFKLPSGRVGVKASVITDAESLASVTDAFALAVPVGDTFAIVFGVTDGGDLITLTVVAYMVADSFEVGDFAADQVDTTTYGNFIGSGSYGSDWEVAIPELRRLVLIPDGGEAVYGEDMLSWGLTPGLWINPDSASEYTDFAMAAVISLRLLEQGDTAICGLITRATSAKNGDLKTFLAVGVTELNTVTVFEVYDPEDDPFFFETDVVDADFYYPQHLLYVVRGDQLTAFVNGVPVIDGLTIPPVDAASTSVLVGVNLGRDCVMSGVWAYGLPSSETDADRALKGIAWHP